jgi:hypothetical protein
MPTTWVEPRPAVAAKSKSRESPGRIALYLLAGAIGIYLATWVGSVTFYLNFQRPLLARERGPLHTVLWLEPQAGLCLQPQAGLGPVEAGGGAWTSKVVDGILVPVPPGRLLEVMTEGEVIRLRLDEGEITISRYPVGFLAWLFREKLRCVAVNTADRLPDDAVLEAVAGETLRKYCFGWSEVERQPYAARLLSKMSLWDLRPVTRFELARREGACAVLAEYESGEVRVVASNPGGALAALIPAGAPAAWKATPASWLEAGTAAEAPSGKTAGAR